MMTPAPSFPYVVLQQNRIVWDCKSPTAAVRLCERAVNKKTL
jgi:hypothetical protein